MAYPATTTVTRRQVLGAASCVTAMLALPGCGRHRSAANEAGIVLTQGPGGLVLYELAVAQGYFRRFGVSPRTLLVADGTKCVAALVSGVSDISVCTGFNQVPAAIGRGARLKVVAGALTLSSLAMFSGKAGITSVADLAGKSVGIGAPGSVLQQVTVLLLRKRGVDVAQVEFRDIGSDADILKAVMAGTIDAGVADVDVMDEQRELGIHALADGMAWKELPEYTMQACYASDSAIRNHRRALVGVLAAFGMAYRYASTPESRHAFLEAWRKVTGEEDPRQGITHWNWIQRYHPYDLRLLLTDEQINYVQQSNVEFGAQKRMLPIAQVADMSLAREALQLMA
jgi:ABC-type nitrate/sulfonate/bicarbonate transport system substrate-binding protein